MLLQVSDLDALHYDEYSISQYTQAEFLLNRAKIEPNFSILDVGCGDGKITAELSLQTPMGRTIGVDPSPNMISYASARYYEGLYKSLEFQKSKAEEMNFKTNMFDLIICSNALMWVRQPKKALKLLCKFLRPGGQLLVFTYLKNTPYVNLFEYVLNKYYPSLIKTSAVNTMLTEIEHKDELEKNSIFLKEFEVENVLFEYKSPADFKNYIQGWLACYAAIPELDQEEFLDRVVECGYFYFSVNSTVLKIPHKTLLINGEKLNK